MCTGQRQRDADADHQICLPPSNTDAPGDPGKGHDVNAVVAPQEDPRRLQVSTQATTPAQLLAMAVQQGADLDRLEKLMDLQERWEANEARKAFTAAMTGFKAEPIQIIKAKHVEFRARDGDVTSYNHAELSDITDAVGPALAKHELSYRWDIRQEGPAITVECILTHVRGHSERVTMTAPPDASGKKNAIQQVASTTTYLQRYTLLAITGMSTKGMDDDARGGDDVGGSALDEWQSVIADAKTDDELESYRDQIRKLDGALRKNVIALFNSRKAELSA